MYSHAKQLALYKLNYSNDVQNYSSSLKTLGDFYDLLNEIEANNKTIKSLNRLIELWQGRIPRGRVSERTRTTFYQLKIFLSENEIAEDIIAQYLQARSKYHRAFTLFTKDDQLDYLHSVTETEGMLLCFASGMSNAQVDFFKQDAKASYLFACLCAVQSDTNPINIITPLSELRRYGLRSISHQEYNKHPGAFREFLEHYSEEIIYYKNLSKSFSKNLPLKYRIAKKISSSQDIKILKKISSQPDWIFYNDPSSVLSYNLKNSIARRLYA
jgi:tetratricopeptide (TPR) repeat protein